MNYSDLFRGAARTVWARKFLIVLGILAIFSGAGGGGVTYTLDGNEGNLLSGAPFRFVSPDIPDFGVNSLLLLLIAMLVFAVMAVLFAIGTIAGGGLIAGIDALDRGKPTSFRVAWGAAWSKAWTLIGIGLLPAIPAFLAVLVGVAGAAASYGLVLDGELGSLIRSAAAITSGVMTAVLLLVALGLALLQVFATRAAVLEDRGLVAAYVRGFSVLWDHIGSALVIFLLQIGISLALGLLLIVPGIVLALCFLFWPLFLIFQGFMIAFFSAVWTRAWEQWTGAFPARNALAGQ